MKIGDAVKLRTSGQVGLVIDISRRAVPDGNPNGDFTFEYRYKVLFGEEAMVIRNRSSLEVINANR